MRTVFRLNDNEAHRLITVENLTVAQVAERLGVSRQAVNHAIRKGRIPAPTARLGSSLAQPDGGTSATPRVETTG